MIPSMQPSHASSDLRGADARLGPAGLTALRLAMVHRSGRDAGHGSDFPVEIVNPFWGIFAASRGRTRRASQRAGRQPAQKLTLEEALADLPKGRRMRLMPRIAWVFSSRATGVT